MSARNPVKAEPAAPGVFRWLVRRYARRHAGVLLLVAGLTLAGNLLAFLQPAILAGLLNTLSGSAPKAPPSTSWLDLNHLGARVTSLVLGGAAADTGAVVAFFSALFVFQAVLVAGTSYASDRAAAWLRARYARMIQGDLLDHLLHQDMAFFTRERTGELVSRVTTDAAHTAAGLGPVVRALIYHGVQIVIYSAYLLGTSVWLTIGSTALLVCQFGLTQALKRPMRRLTRAETDSTGLLVSTVQESLTSVRVTKSFSAEQFELDKLRSTVERVSETVLRKALIEKVEAPARSVLDSLAVLGIFLMAVLQVRAGNLTLEGLLLFTYVGRLLIVPINGAATTALWIESTKAAYSRISELMAEHPRIVDGSRPVPGFQAALEIRNVSFSYGDRRAIEGMNLEVRKGEFVAIVGPSGAGKSTLADLVLRLYDPDEGQILIDGADVRALRQRDYRRLFGVVSQESLLFNDTVRNNIRFGRAHLAESDIEEAAKIANAHAFIQSLPDGYDTPVGDRGVRLSGGERQRIAIARAVVDHPQILILDEATSALDSESERLVRNAIDRVVENTTAIVIAHRLSTVMHADRIVVLSEGRTEAVGPHAVLLETSPTYRRFCHLQFDAPNGGELVPAT